MSTHEKEYTPSGDSLLKYPVPDEPLHLDDDELVFEGKYWRWFNEHEVRHHQPLTSAYSDYGVSTRIYSSMESRERRRIADQLLHTHLRVLNGSYRGRHLQRLLDTVDSICGAFQLPRGVCESARTYIRKLMKHKMQFGDIARVATAFYAALNNSCHTTSMLADILRYLQPDLGDEQVTMLMRYARKRSYDTGILGVCANTRLAVSRIMNELCGKLRGCSDEAVRLAERITSAYYSPSSPRGTAGALLYTAMKLLGVEVTQKAIARQLGISEATVRNAFKRLRIHIEYYYCNHSGCSKVDEWYPGIHSIGILSPQSVVPGVAANGMDVRIEVGRPIKVHIVDKT